MAWTNLGNAYISQGKYLKALDALDKSLDIDHKNAQTYFNKGDALQRLKRGNEAKIAYDQAVYLDSYYIDTVEE